MLNKVKDSWESWGAWPQREEKSMMKEHANLHLFITALKYNVDIPHF